MPSEDSFKENAGDPPYVINRKVRPVDVPQLSSKASPKATRRDVKSLCYIYDSQNA